MKKTTETERRDGTKSQALPMLAAALAAAAILAGCGEKEEPDLAGLPAAPTTTTSPATTTTADPGEPSGAPQNGDGGQPANEPGGGGARERAVAETVRDYVGALDSGDGARVCSLLVPGALEPVDLPFRRDGCAASLTRSIGFADPRGLPVFAGADLRRLAVHVRGEQARAVATVLTSFSDRPQPSLEDDVIYLEPDRDRWLIAKPSATLYRAVGIADVPPSVLAPPRG